MVEDTTWPRGITFPSGDNVDMQLRRLISNCGNVQLGRLKLGPEDTLRKIKLLDQLLLISSIKIHDSTDPKATRYEKEPRVA